VLWFAHDGTKEIKKLFTASPFSKPVIFYNSHNTIFQSSNTFPIVRFFSVLKRQAVSVLVLLEETIKNEPNRN